MDIERIAGDVAGWVEQQIVDKLDDALRRITRQTAQNEIGKKPEVTVVISRMR